MGEWEDPFNVLGFVGGVVLAAALLPQIYLAHKRKSTADISYMWQAVYTVGLLIFMVYYAHFELWPVFYPMAFEFSCLLYLTGLKIFYEVVLKKVDSTLDDVASEFDASRSGRMGDRALSETGSRKGSVVGAIMSDFDMSRSGRVGRVLSDASRNGRLGRMGSNSSIVSDTSKSGKAVVPGTRAGAAGAVAGLFAPKLGGLTEAEGEAANGAAAADNQV